MVYQHGGPKQAFADCPQEVGEATDHWEKIEGSTNYAKAVDSTVIAASITIFTFTITGFATATIFAFIFDDFFDRHRSSTRLGYYLFDYIALM